MNEGKTQDKRGGGGVFLGFSNWGAAAKMASRPLQTLASMALDHGFDLIVCRMGLGHWKPGLTDIRVKRACAPRRQYSEPVWRQTLSIRCRENAYPRTRS